MAANRHEKLNDEMEAMRRFAIKVKGLCEQNSALDEKKIMEIIQSGDSIIASARAYANLLK